MTQNFQLLYVSMSVDGTEDRLQSNDKDKAVNSTLEAAQLASHG